MSEPVSGSGFPRELPLVGREDDLEVLYTLFGTADGTPPMAVLTGETGVGKSRLARTVAGEARRRDWTVAYGRAYPVETGVPYALVSDAFLPLLKEMDEATLTVLTRGTAHELHQLFPALETGERSIPDLGEDPDESRMRLYWNFTEFLKRLAERRELLVVLEDLHWADASSLSLLHFLARQVEDEPLRILATSNTDYREANERLIRAERSLASIRRLRRHDLQPLDRDATERLLEETFEVSGPPLRDFAGMLFGWTRGNPYFIEETLKTLVQTGALYERDGTWLGWEEREPELPATIRDAVVIRLRELDEAARAVTWIMAVVGAGTDVRLLESVSELPTTTLYGAVEELVRMGLVDEHEEDGLVRLEFRHPMVRETIYQGLSISRRRRLHAAVAESLERLYGARAEEHADELAYHFAEAGEGSGDPRAVRYLASAGRAALRRHADREATAYLEAAVQRLAGTEPEEPPEPEPPSEPESAVELAALKAELARARTRVGKFAEAADLWKELLHSAREEGDVTGAVQGLRHLGLLRYWGGEHEEALELYREALGVLEGGEAVAPVDGGVGRAAPGVRDAGNGARAARAASLEARLCMSAGVALQELGRADQAREWLERALEIAEELEEPAMLGRAHRALALLYTWIGRPEAARKHGWQAVELADRIGDGHVRFWGRWALAALEGMTGDTEEMARLQEQARAVAEELRSPVLRLWASELFVEYDYATGRWDEALAIGERAISLATALNQRNLLPRLQVWTALVYLGRGDLDRRRELVEEAWRLAGLEEGDGDGEGRTSRWDIHVVIPAHIGMAALRIAEGRSEEAVEVGRAGLRIADRAGYVFWVLHHLLPMYGEALLRAGRLDEAVEVGERLRTESAALNHSLGLAWADACDAIVAWHSGETERGAKLLRAAAEDLEEIPILPEATRIRRQLAGRLADLGKRDAALAELRRVHEIFGRLGAQPELEKTRIQFRELDARPPSRSQAEGTAELTGRESEIARLVADRMSNKAIAKELDISPRTVTTHLTNIYRKTDIGSRAELGDMVREGRLAVEAVEGLPD